ncbi:MAG: hypothetical protein JNK89_08700 [Saprospiraceae bacterium]|nr:hypothetical protein [Saprospiraceae bacterium]
MKKNLLFACFCCAWLGACNKESGPTNDPSPALVPLFELGDTVRNDNTTSYEESTILIDSSGLFGFKLISTHNTVLNHSSTYFIRLELEYPDQVRFLSSWANGGGVFQGPILSTFDDGDTIDVNVASNGVLGWYPELEIQMVNTGWLKYHIFTAQQGSAKENIASGENYVVFKFGEPGKERIGWLDIEYRDTLCYIERGFYHATPNQGIIVGKL